MGEFGKLLRETRRATNRTMGELARFLDVKVQYLSGVEVGVRPPLSSDRIVAAATFLGSDPTPLLLAAAKARGAFRLDAALTTAKGKEVLATLARELPTIGDEQWSRIQSIVEERGSE